MTLIFISPAFAACRIHNLLVRGSLPCCLMLLFRSAIRAECQATRYLQSPTSISPHPTLGVRSKASFFFIFLFPLSFYWYLFYFLNPCSFRLSFVNIVYRFFPPSTSFTNWCIALKSFNILLTLSRFQVVGLPFLFWHKRSLCLLCTDFGGY